MSIELKLNHSKVKEQPSSHQNRKSSKKKNAVERAAHSVLKAKQSTSPSLSSTKRHKAAHTTPVSAVPTASMPETWVPLNFSVPYPALVLKTETVADDSYGRPLGEVLKTKTIEQLFQEVTCWFKNNAAANHSSLAGLEWTCSVAESLYGDLGFSCTRADLWGLFEAESNGVIPSAAASLKNTA